MKFVFILVLLGILQLNCSHGGPLEEKEKVKLDVYYECLCPGCKNLWTTELHPLMNEIGKEYIDLNIYPFGNARIEQDGSVSCQHGPDECYGNTVHACAVDLIKPDVLQYVNFIACLMGDSSSDWGIKHCAGYVKINTDLIKKCAKSDRGYQLLKNYGKETEKVHMQYAPWVVINNQHMDYRKVLKEEVCKAFKQPPKECSNYLV